MKPIEVKSWDCNGKPTTANKPHSRAKGCNLVRWINRFDNGCFSDLYKTKKEAIERCWEQSYIACPAFETCRVTITLPKSGARSRGKSK